MQNEDQPKYGRPSAYSDKIAEAICDRLVDGESLRAICADPGMPARATVFRWLASNQEFRNLGNLSCCSATTCCKLRRHGRGPWRHIAHAGGANGAAALLTHPVP